MMAEKSYSRSQMIGKVILFLVLCIFAVILFIPLYWMVQTSFDAACVVDATVPAEMVSKGAFLGAVSVGFQTVTNG